MATFEEFMKVAEISIKDKTSHKRMNEIVRTVPIFCPRPTATPSKNCAMTRIRCRSMW